MLKIGIDLDSTITANGNSEKFFSLLTKYLHPNKGYFYIVTDRDNSEESKKEIKKELKKRDIIFDELIITGDKAKAILDNDISIYFDDTDEYFQYLPKSVTVFKIREEGNFNFDNGKWIYGPKTGELFS